jgi:DNA polymerase-3 subunit beta
MKITTNKTEFLKGLTLVQGVVEKKKTLPILSNVLIEANKEEQQITLTATDLEIGIKTKFKSEIFKEGKITISAKKIFEIVKELTDEIIDIEVKDNNWIEIKNGKAKFNIVGLSAEEFPLINDKNSNEDLKLKTEVLKEIIDKTFYAISHDESKFNLNGIFLHTIKSEQGNYLRFVATDGHRLALKQIDNEENFEIRDKGTDENNILISIVDNNAIFKLNNTTLVMRLIDGDFPDYNRVIPDFSEKYCLIENNQLLHSLRRISLLANEKSKGINIEFIKDEIKISSSNPEYGDAVESIKTTYDGNEMKIGFNSKYLLDVISNIDTKEIKLHIKDNMSPCLIVPSDNKNNLAVIMPMRI